MSRGSLIDLAADDAPVAAAFLPQPQQKKAKPAAPFDGGGGGGGRAAAAAGPTSYMQMLSEAKHAAVPNRAPAHPGKGASKEALEAYQEALEIFQMERDAESIQRSTLEDEKRKKSERATAKRQLAESGRIGSFFSAKAGSALLAREGGSAPLRALVEHLDGCSEALEGAVTLSVLLTRAGAGGVSAGRRAT